MSRAVIYDGRAFIARVDDRDLADLAGLDGVPWRDRIIRPLIEEADRLGAAIEVWAGDVLLDYVTPRGRRPRVVEEIRRDNRLS